MSRQIIRSSILQQLKETVSKKDRKQSQDIIKELQNCGGSLLKDIESHKEQKIKESETYKYWDGFIKLVYLLKDIIRADREGNWKLHLHTVQQILPIFAAFDCTNYLRWCSIYLEDMRKLEDMYPEVYREFMRGNFVVKRTLGLFKAVGVDMALEQTINRSQKSAGGIIGSTRKKEFVAQWELIYHEMLAVSNLYRELSGVKMAYYELDLDHEFSPAETEANEERLTEMRILLLPQMSQSFITSLHKK